MAMTLDNMLESVIDAKRVFDRASDLRVEMLDILLALPVDNRLDSERIIKLMCRIDLRDGPRANVVGYCLADIKRKLRDFNAGTKTWNK